MNKQAAIKRMSAVRVLTALSFLIFFHQQGTSQSFELMPGTERIFIDAQWLKAFDTEFKWTLFSRARATADYDGNTDLFTGAYLNYTTSSGFGGTIVGRIANSGAGFDVGPHFFKAKENWMLYALASITIQSELSYSWFSIFRYTPDLNEQWKAYTSLELFSNFNSAGNTVSVQRIRLGVDRSGYQFGLALNLAFFGPSLAANDTNPGLFLRKQF